jgi:hypothetical protein
MGKYLRGLRAALYAVYEFVLDIEAEASLGFPPQIGRGLYNPVPVRREFSHVDWFKRSEVVGL